MTAVHNTAQHCRAPAVAFFSFYFLFYYFINFILRLRVCPRVPCKWKNLPPSLPSTAIFVVKKHHTGATGPPPHWHGPPSAAINHIDVPKSESSRIFFSSKYSVTRILFSKSSNNRHRQEQNKRLIAKKHERRLLITYYYHKLDASPTLLAHPWSSNLQQTKSR